MTEATLPLIETTLLKQSVKMRYANNPDPAKATVWVDFQVPVSELVHPMDKKPLGNPQNYFVAELQLAALQFVRTIIAGEIHPRAEWTQKRN